VTEVSSAQEKIYMCIDLSINDIEAKGYGLYFEVEALPLHRPFE
jgi:hypothetical protein